MADKTVTVLIWSVIMQDTLRANRQIVERVVVVPDGRIGALGEWFREGTFMFLRDEAQVKALKQGELLKDRYTLVSIDDKPTTVKFDNHGQVVEDYALPDSRPILLTLTANEVKLWQMLKTLKPGRLFVVNDLPVPDSYEGLKTDDMLSLIGKIEQEVRIPSTFRYYVAVEEGDNAQSA